MSGNQALHALLDGDESRVRFALGSRLRFVASELFEMLAVLIELVLGRQHRMLTKAIRTNLAVELAPEFGRVVDPMVDRLARESLADVKRANVEISELSLSGVPGVCGGSYDLLSDS